MARSDGSASPPPEARPEDDGRPKVLSINIKDQQENEVFFKIKTTTRLGKVFDSYCERQEVGRRSVRFLLDGDRIQDTDTPESLEIEDGDMIQCVLEQTGGEGTPEGDPKPEDQAPTHLNVNVKDQDGNDLYFKIKKHTPLKKVMDAYCERQGKARGLVRFLFEGTRVQDNDTPDSLELEDGDMIQVFLEQQGGEDSQAGDDAGPDPVLKHINIKVKDDDGHEIAFKLKKTTPLKKLMDAYAQQQGKAPDTLRFYTPEGHRVLPSDTPDSIELEDGDMIDVHIEQHGGAEGS
jgi:hypothetical protein